MPWQWEGAPLEWMQLIALYINARDAARQEQKPMSEAQVAPYKMSKQEAEAHLRRAGMLP